jgi:hypothetical protein
MRPPYPGCCQHCPRADRVPAVHTYVDSRGYENHLCERHYAGIARWLKGQRQEAKDRALHREAEREAKRRRGGIVTAEDFLRDGPDE